MKRFLSLVLVASNLCLNTWAASNTREFSVNDEAGRDAVHFILDAPLEVINGTTNQIKGKFTFEKEKLSGQFTVPVSSLKTGISTRDEHLQNDKWMDSKKFPTIEFNFKNAVVPTSVWKGEPTRLEVSGLFKMHGVEHTEKVQLTLIYLPQSADTEKRLPGNLLRAKADFTLHLSDYKIAQSDSKVKELLGLKVGKEATVKMDVVASDKVSL